MTIMYEMREAFNYGEEVLLSDGKLGSLLPDGNFSGMVSNIRWNKSSTI